MEDDRAYYERRAEAEWRAGIAAPDAQSRRLHFELAEMLRVKAMLQHARTSAVAWHDRGSAPLS